ncbi:hypothetical protein Cgig2_014926 [Carnegiea gigantea]|uniref:Uncharacterized protein n=1 Tax=Carnegiea gigantea TaxID=171969 RepID=A0A9Q1JV06_9CARY|nr:hypothetical protein Cgig2_014926 [Carnegiea gigantea]
MEAPPKLSLSSDEFQNCSRALEFFNKKLQNHQLIETRKYDLNQPNLQSCVLWLLITSIWGRIVTMMKLFLLYKSNFCIPYLYVISNHLVYSNWTSIFLSTVVSYRRFTSVYSHTRSPVMHYRCPPIVMLTCLVENGKVVKCDDYFQEEDGPRKFGNIFVTTNLMVKTESSLALRLLAVTKTEQFTYLATQASVVFMCAAAVVIRRATTFGSSHSPSRLARAQCSGGHINRPRDLQKNIQSVTWCIAGIGRTGTYCVIHDTVQRILAGDMTALDVVNTLAVHRSQREEMVKNSEQYCFCHDAVVDALEELISGYNAETRLSSSASNGEDVERQRVREASDETPHQDRRPRVH